MPFSYRIFSDDKSIYSMTEILTPGLPIESGSVNENLRTYDLAVKKTVPLSFFKC